MHNEKADRTKGNHKKGTGIYPAAVFSGAVVASDGSHLGGAELISAGAYRTGCGSYFRTGQGGIY